MYKQTYTHIIIYIYIYIYIYTYTHTHTQWFNSPKISLPGQATNGIQHDQELCLLHPLQLW